MSDTDTTETDDSTAVVRSDSGITEAIAALKAGKSAMYSSIKGTSFEARKSVLNAVMGSVAIAENLGKTIDIQDIIVQKVEMLNERSGELEPQPRILLIDKSGTAYHAISAVLFRDIQNVLAILGDPSEWKAPLKASVVKRGTGTRQFFTMELVGEK